MSRSHILTMVRSATTTAAANSGRLEPPPNHNHVWKRGHVSRGSVGDKIQVIPGFKTSAGMYTHSRNDVTTLKRNLYTLFQYPLRSLLLLLASCMSCSTRIFGKSTLFNCRPHFSVWTLSIPSRPTSYEISLQPLHINTTNHLYFQ